jgi:hypothetical protein
MSVGQAIPSSDASALFLSAMRWEALGHLPDIRDERRTAPDTSDLLAAHCTRLPGRAEPAHPNGYGIATVTSRLLIERPPANQLRIEGLAPRGSGVPTRSTA